MIEIGFLGVKISGRDAGQFLHRVTTANFSSLAVGKIVRGVLCAGNSKMISQFDGLRLALDEFLLVVPDYLQERTLAALEAVHFSEDLLIANYPSRFNLGNLGNGLRPLEFESSQEGGLRWIYAISNFEITTMPTQVNEGDFHFQRIGSLVPWPDLDWTCDNFALESGVLPWLDRNKGCYPGQEVVEKSLNLGHPARMLVAYESTDLDFSQMENLEEIQGKLTSHARQGALSRALIRIPWKHRDSVVAAAKKIKTHWPE